MKRCFILLELVAVITIISALIIIGFTHCAKTLSKSKVADTRMTIRKVLMLAYLVRPQGFIESKILSLKNLFASLMARKQMEKGFTLLELIVVIIILGVLATLGLGQYGRMIERSRGAEAKVIIGDIRKYGIAYYMEYGTLTGISDAKLSLGTAADQIPTACRGSHYFSYTYTVTATLLSSTATRCTASGKTPQAATATTLILSSTMSNGADLWAGNGGY